MLNRSLTLSLKTCVFLIGVLLSAVTLWVYWPAQHFDFLNWDDLTYVSTNDHVRGGLTWNGILWSFTHSYSSNWHPLTWLSHMLDCQLYGLNPGSHHLTNVLFHAANGVLLFLLLRALTATLWRSAFVAALFALHPLHVESVAWVAERKDVLSAFFFLLALWAYTRYVAVQSLKSKVQGPGAEVSGRWPVATAHHATRAAPPVSSLQPPVFYYLSLMFFALGLMSKPMLVTLPFVLLLMDYWPLNRFESNPQAGKIGTLASLVREKLPFFALSAVASLRATATR